MKKLLLLILIFVFLPAQMPANGSSRLNIKKEPAWGKLRFDKSTHNSYELENTTKRSLEERFYYPRVSGQTLDQVAIDNYAACRNILRTNDSFEQKLRTCPR